MGISELNLKKGAHNWSGKLDSGGIANATVDEFGLLSTSGLPLDTRIQLVIDRVDISGTETPDKMEIIEGKVDGLQIIDVVRGVRGTAQGHSPSAVVEVMLTDDMWNDLIDFADSQAKGWTAVRLKNDNRPTCAGSTAVTGGGGHNTTRRADVVIPGVNLTEYIKEVTRVRFYQNGAWVYGLCNLDSELTGGTDTTIHVYLGTVGEIVSTSTHEITAFEFSHHLFPPGISPNPEVWAIDRPVTSVMTTTSTSYVNVDSMLLNIHPGKWRVKWEACGGVTVNTSKVSSEGVIGLSLADNNLSDMTRGRAYWKTQIGSSTSALRDYSPYTLDDYVDFAVETAVYLVARAGFTGETMVIHVEGTGDAAAAIFQAIPNFFVPST